MITITFNNFGGVTTIFKDYQIPGFCILNGKVSIDPTNPYYIAATRLELDLPIDFTMQNSAISTAVLVSNAPIYRFGTVLQCFIENNKLCIEKLPHWDAYGTYEIYINSAFVTRGYRGTFTETKKNYLSIDSSNSLFAISSYHYVETDYYVYLTVLFNTFPAYSVHGTGPFDLKFYGFATNVDIEIPIIVDGSVHSGNIMGSKITCATFANNHLTFSYPEGAHNIGGSHSFINFFAVCDEE